MAEGAGASAGARADAVGQAGASGASDIPAGKTAFLIGQSGRRAHVDYVLGTASVPGGGSVYAELYTGKWLSFEQEAFVDYLASYYPGSFVEVGLSWKDNRVNAGYCDLAEPACVAAGGATLPELDIVAGRYDAALKALGQSMRARPQLTFLVRVDYEVSPNLHCAPADHDDCPAYAAAFRHLHDLWRAADIGNLQLVFHPTRGWARQMYPGPELTDWIAFSVFNHDLCLPTPEGPNRACAAGAHIDPNLAADLAWAAEQGKPILIAESSVQKPSDESAQGFNEYLGRLFELVDQRPAVRALTYINMQWAGGWIYGEDWTQGAFGHVDARLGHFTETRAYFCEVLGQGRYTTRRGETLGCDQPAAASPVLPPDFDAPAYERLVLVGSNRCAMVAASPNKTGPVQQGDCAPLGSTGQSRFRIAESRQGAEAQRIWSDLSWQCWSAEGEQLLQRPCSDAPAQQFRMLDASAGAGDRDVRIVASDGRCIGIKSGEAAEQPLHLSACNAVDALQIFRL